ncbi:MAG TPA: V-type ATP synthase subunit K [Spirochaetota bacterium]|nr:V-type ATP synthase subunit K [Spirochaetota bacterium]HOM37607.1 V-type ATP synthase subunit K [Spirochaetota bacterium]HPQ49422.1 V-type ATP synthase subunit K [Spirochaetota bacterium]
MIGLAIGIFGIGLAVALAGIGSSIGIRVAAEAANAAMIEEPKNFGKYLVLTALPGTQGIYGFVIGFLALAKLRAEMAFGDGLALLFACLPIALAGLFSAIYQGKVTAAGINMTVKHPEESGKALVLGVFVEFYAILGFVISIMLLNSGFFK